MTPDLSHEEAFAALDAAALDILEEREREAVLAHVSGCTVCREELEARRATVSNLAFAAAIPADTPAANDRRMRMRQRLVARATAEGQARRLANPPLVFPKADASGPARQIISFDAWRRARSFAIAASILLVASVGLLALTFRDDREMRGTVKAQLAQVSAAQRTSDSLAAALSSRDSLIAGLAGRNVAMMTLTSSAAKEPFARMFWDQKRNTWTLIAHNMPPLRAGRTYQLWLVTPTAKISAGTFDPHNGNAIVQATYALSPDALRAIAVTEEPAGGMPQPTSAPVVAATR